MAKRPTVVITGANGFLGSALVRHFANLGWKVTALVRNPSKQNRHPGVRYVAYDLTGKLDESVFKGADYVIHTAYIKADSRHLNAMEVNVDAAQQLLAASRKYKLKKNLFMSSMSAHEAAESVYGRQKLAIERIFNSNKDVNIRSGLIVGKGGIVSQMAAFMRSKRLVPLVGGGQQPLQITGVYDLVRVIERLLVTPRLHGTFTIATPQVYTYKEFYEAIASQLGIRIFFVPMPLSLLVAVLRLVGWLRLPLAISTDNVLGLKMLRSTDTSGDLKRIGITLDPLEIALKKSGLTTRQNDKAA